MKKNNTMNIQYRMSNIQCRSKNHVFVNSHLKKQSQFYKGLNDCK